MLWLKWLVGIPAALALLVLIGAQFGLLSGKQPSDLGVRDGKLKRPSATPNSVSSQARQWADDTAQAAHVEPLTLPKGLDGPQAIARLRAIVEAMPGARMVEARGDYLYAQFTTKLMRYVDDVEFWFDPAAGVVQTRSASRVGRKDFGVNRSRVETIRSALSAARVGAG
jgi:uncharacterized protein (DUF1499 family)